MKWITGLLTLIGICIFIFAIRSFLSGGDEKQKIPFALPDSYSSIMEPADVSQYATNAIEVYEVKKVTATQIDLVAQPHKDWQGIIRFNPSQTPPIVAKFEKVDHGVYSTGMLRLTPNTHGGFDYLYLEEGKGPMKGVLRPNWY